VRVAGPMLNPMLIPGGRSIQVLTHLIRTRKIPHAMLFTGIDGVGRYQTAIRLAMALNCTGQPDISTESDGQNTNGDSQDPAYWPVCGSCPACRKIITGEHPDILSIQPAGNALKIDQIRSLCDTLALKPYDARYRFAILEKAQAMTLPAANALLKMLEEPPARTTLILIANKPSDLLPTIFSRCQHLRFPPLPEEQIARSIADSEGISEEASRLIAAMAGGSHQTAREMDSGQWLRQRHWLMDELMQIHRGPAPDKTGSTRRIMALADILARDPQHIFHLLGIMKSWLRDLAMVAFTPEHTINRDRTDQIKEVAASVPSQTFVGSFEALEKIEKQILANANPRLALETYLATLAQNISTSGGLESIKNYG